jgi:hypothetical protein
VLKVMWDQWNLVFRKGRNVSMILRHHLFEFSVVPSL